MIDRWLCERAKDDFSGEYDPEQAITGRTYLNPGAENLIVIFPPWHGGSPLTDLLARRRALSHAVLKYDFHDMILEPYAERVEQSFKYIADTVSKDLYDLPAWLKYKKVHFIGISMGNVAMAMTAGKYHDIDSATMITAGDDLAAALWQGERTQHLRRRFEEQGLTENKLRRYWYDLAPKRYAKYFRDKPVKTLVSRNDSIIPSFQQFDMTQALKTYEARVNDTYTSLGHIAAITSYCVTR
jgi:pimeloyl-ACP methyl ester carboxylesterase